MRRAWWGPACDEDQRAVLDLVDDLVETRLIRTGDERPEEIDAARRTLAEYGLWTLGADESRGGGGADLSTTLIALARLAGTWPALAWASVQSHAAAIVLGEGPERNAAVLADIHHGAPVAVCPVDADVAEDASALLVEGRLTCTVDRVDAAGREPCLVLLLDRGTAVVVPPDGARFGSVLRRTGLDGALTVASRVDVVVPADAVIRGEHIGRARAMLHVGAAALAAGIAEAAAQAAAAYSASRVQFGAPLTELPTVRASLTEQAAAARGLLAALAVAGLDRPDTSAPALVRALDTALDVAASAVQSHGGYGYMAEYRVEALLRDVVSLRAATHAFEAARAASNALVEAQA